MIHGQLKLFSGSAHPALAKEIAEHLGIPLGVARLHRFPDTEVSFQIDENIRGTDVFIVQPTSAPVDQHLIELCVMIDAFRRSSASRITAVIPYYGYARQDRRTSRACRFGQAGRQPARGCRHRSRTHDGSAQAQIQGLFRHPGGLTCLPRRSSLIPRPAGLRWSDDRVARRGRRRAWPVPTASAWTRARDIDKRPQRDGTAEVMNVVGDVKGRICVIADDIIDTAGTIQKAGAGAGLKTVRAVVLASAVPRRACRGRRSRASRIRRSTSWS
jgi:ribose-phosphate pyrophosphokinase